MGVRQTASNKTQRVVRCSTLVFGAFLAANAPVSVQAAEPGTVAYRSHCDFDPTFPFDPKFQNEDFLGLHKKPKKMKEKDFIPEQEYRYDFEERHLTWGIDGGGGLASGVTLNGFPYGGTLTPYFKGGFGDGNALEFDVTVGISPLNAAQSQWLFFRTPVLDGSLAYGNVFFIAPTIAFRYELELTPSISQRGMFLTWGGVGLGPMLTFGSASLTNNGKVADLALTNQQIFFDIVPTAGFKMRLSEFSYLEIGARYHILIELASKLKDDTSFVTGTPSTIQEFWIGNSGYLDAFLGFSHDFG